MKRTRQQRGVTLLELLIAVTLVSLLSVGILYGMRVGLQALEKTNNRFMANRRVVGVERALQQQLAGLIPIGSDCLSADGVPRGKVRFWEGSPQQMRFVTNYSLNENARGYPRIVEYAVIPGQDDVGVRLIVNESIYNGPISLMGHCVGIGVDPVSNMPMTLYRPVIARPDSFVLADKLASVRFVYLETLPPPILQKWTPTWVLPAWPSAIRLELVPLDANPGNLDVATTTVPIRITADPFKRYAD